MTPEQIAASKARSKLNIDEFDKDLAADVEAVPWLKLLFVVVVFAG